MTDKYSPILDYLSKYSLQAIIKNQRVVTLADTCTIERALDTLARNQVRSAPVLNASNKQNSERILGIVGTIDICYYILQIAPNPTIMSKRELNNFFMDGYGISNEKIYKIVDKSNLNPVEVFSPTVSLKSVVASCLSRGVHRVLIVEENEIVSTVSRSDIVRFIWAAIERGVLEGTSSEEYLPHRGDHEHEMVQLTKTELETFSRFGSLPIKGTVANFINKMITCRDTDPVLLVLDRLKDCGHKSLPVVDANDKLVSNFSSSEVTALIKDAWPSFGEPVLAYKDYSNGLYGSKTQSLIYATEDETIRDVLKKLVGGKKSIHCLWIVDKDMKPIGSISLTDVLRFATTWNGE